MSYQVYILEDAEQDIKDIYYYVVHHDSKANALKLIDELEAACFTLDNLPGRGIAAHELKEIGVSNICKSFVSAIELFTKLTCNRFLYTPY